MRRRLLLSALAALAAALSPAPAHAQVAWAPCTDAGFERFECGRANVPIDRSGGVPGAIDLFARRLVAPANPNRAALVFLSGGPGQAATASAAGAAVALAPALGDRDLLVFDQRGTGASGALRCAALTDDDLGNREIAERCANEIGPQRAFYRTADSVSDLEDLRAAAGYERLVLYGVSYGTKVALAYAARHPDRVERLVLDSVVPPEGPDALRRPSFAASARVLDHVCGGGVCRGITASVTADVRRIVSRGRVRGRYVTARGRIRRGVMNASEIYDLLEATDLNPAFRAMMPAALRSAARGDAAALLRLASTVFLGDGSQVPNSGVNRALYLATVCEEIAFPWDRGAAYEQRLDQATAAVNAVSPGAIGPFNLATVAGASLVPVCLGWPHAAPPPGPPGELPRVPSLILAGEADVRTPVEDARNVAGRLGATAVVVPHTGHSVLGSDFSGCARAAVAAFFGDGTTPACPAGVEPAVFPSPRPPRSLREVAGARRYKGRIGKTLNAVALTRNDALVAALGAEIDGLRRVAGVRRGTIGVSNTGVSLRGVEFVPGVRVTGRFPNRGTRARLTITGRAAARGKLTLTRNGSVSGRLGGRRIRARPRAATLSGPFGGPPEARRLLPFPAIRGE